MAKLVIITCFLALLGTPAMAGPLHDAVKAGDAAEVKRLIVDGEDVNERAPVKGTPLHQAAIWAGAEIAELLLAAGADSNSDDSILGTPLKMAALKGNTAVAVVLIAHGADVNAASADGTTPLHSAAAGGRAAMVDLLVASGADVNAKSLVSGSTDFAPIHSAGLDGHFDVVELLRALGATGPTVPPVAGLLSSADPSEGENVFNDNCSLCHSIEKGAAARQGPNLWGVLGSKKASVEDYSYSQALGRLVGTWTPTEFNAYVAAPMDYVPGTKMNVRGISDPVQRADLIGFLSQHSDDPPPLPLGP